MTTETSDEAAARLGAFACEGGVPWPDEPGVTLREWGPCFRGTRMSIDVLAEGDPPDGFRYAHETLPEAVIAAGRDYWERHAALFEAAYWLSYTENAAFPSPEGDQLATLQADIRTVLARLEQAEATVARLGRVVDSARAVLTVVAQQAHGAHGGRGSFRWCGVDCCRNAHQFLDAPTLPAPPAATGVGEGV